jgi:thiosulfate/3-mercaptopyruvate sulfurtransferase
MRAPLLLVFAANAFAAVFVATLPERAAAFSTTPFFPTGSRKGGRSGASLTLRGGSTIAARMSATDGLLVSCDWLKENFANVKVLDASWYVKGMERSPGVKFDAVGDFEKHRIPGSGFFDIDKICDLSSSLPHMMPTASYFAECVSKLGVTKDSLVVVYDGKGIFSSPRAWTMFQCFGHEKCYILEGGFPAWVAAGFDVDSSFLSSELPADSQVEYGTATGPVDIIDMQAVKANMENPQFQLVDARPYPRFTGDAPEPRPIESGHLQDSFSVPFLDVVSPEGKMKSEAEIKEIFIKGKVDVTKPLAVTCGSGATACVLRAALYKIGVTKVPLYDGSYAEWKIAGNPTYKGTEKSPYA